MPSLRKAKCHARERLKNVTPYSIHYSVLQGKRLVVREEYRAVNGRLLNKNP